MSQMKALSAHFPNNPRQRVQAWVTQGVTCNHDVQVPPPVETKSHWYRCHKPSKMPWNYPQEMSVSVAEVEM
jgi:hypothetical protein